VHNALALFYLRRIKQLTTPASIIEFALARYAQKTFLIEPERNLSFTFENFEHRIKTQLAGLRQKGLRRGSVVTFCGQNCSEYFELRAACHLSGMVFMGLPASLAPDDIEYFKYKGQNASPGENASPREAFSPVSTLNLSSGTTSRTPKIVQLTDENWIESLYNYVRNADLRQGDKKDVFMCTVPLVTAGSTTFLPALLAGLTYIIIKEDTPIEEIVKHARNYKVTRLYITPSRLMELMEWCKQKQIRLGGLKNIVAGTEGFPVARLKEAIDFFGPIITRGYGMVEVLPPISLLSPADYARGLGSVGRVLKGVHVKIIGEGKIAIKGKTVSAGYLDNPEETSARFKGDWFMTNDYGRLEGGFLYVRGREEEIVAREPQLVFANEAEEAIYTLPFVRQCAVIPGEPVRIFVSLRLQAQVSPEEVKEKIAGAFPSPGAVIIIKESLPISPLGKLDRLRLASEG